MLLQYFPEHGIHFGNGSIVQDSEPTPASSARAGQDVAQKKARSNMLSGLLV
ncbi:hypothetical protein RCH09_001404 [Actimicrobium sp. GrIS 1.19]|uniref:hypothetical protein n=1 Tax=Actimicrobium sp. GrIS 1.19 TaxID=3071708 RepID=UPI002DF9F990|nr:hypothetical protein [Actimicrobium sp. GrIS 1.19]